MLVAHLTDFHALPTGKLIAGKLDSNQMARNAVEAVNNLPVPVDCVVVTGDLTHDASEEAMVTIRGIMDQIEAPMYPLCGGHDDLDCFLRVFSDNEHIANSVDGCYTVSHDEIEIVALNTMGRNGSAPSLGDDRLDWLSSSLKRATKPVLLMMHHPPIQTRVPVALSLDDPDSLWAGRLKSIIESAGCVRLVVCGHVHCLVQTLWAGTHLSVGLATSVQSTPRFDAFVENADRTKRNVDLVLEPPGFVLYKWEHSSFKSYVRYVQQFPVAKA